MVYCLTVTYGNRSALFTQVIERVLEEKIDRIIVVNNNATEESNVCLESLKKQNPGKIEIIKLNRNTGTAFAIKAGFEYACRQNECKYIWLLDDDNLPEEGTLNKILDFSKTLGNIEEFCITSDRVGSHYINCIKENNPMIALGMKNGFWGFHIFNIPQKILKRIKKDQTRTTALEYGEIRMVPYGGLFINKAIIQKVGYPDVGYFMYVDDYEYTYRIGKNGYKIYLLGTTKIYDLEKGWEESSKGFHFTRLAKSGSPIRLYYSVRNMIKFQKCNTVSNKFIFYINLSSFLALFLFSAIARLKIKNIVTMVFAMYAGLTNECGESNKYSLYSLSEKKF